MPRIVTANHLAAGDVVFLAENGWTPNVDLASVAEDEAGVAGLEARAAEAEAATSSSTPTRSRSAARARASYRSITAR